MAATINIIIDQGSDFEYVYELMANGVPQDTTGLSVKASMKPEYTSTNSVLFTSSLSGSNLTLSMPANTTANLNAIGPVPGTWVYDAILYSNTTLQRVIQGRVQVTPQVTTR